MGSITVKHLAKGTLMDIALFWSIFVILGVTYFAVAMSASRALEPDESFFYGQRNFGFIALTLSLAATHIGGGMVLGTSEEAYRHGFNGIFYNLGVALGFIILGLLAFKIRKESFSTMVEIFSTKYGSKTLRCIASLMSILTLSGILVGQIIASRKLLDSLVGQYQWILIIFWLLVIIYTLFGGLRAVIATEIFQIIFVMSISSAMLAFYLKGHSLAFNPKDYVEELISTKFDRHFFSMRHGVLFFMPLFYAIIAQDLGQRVLSARSSLVASISCFLAGALVLVFSFIPVIVGLEARHLGLHVNVNSSVFLALFSKTEPFFYYLLICGVIAAISSTADAVLCAIGSNVIEDFGLNLEHSEKYIGIMFSRIAIFIIGIISLVIAYQVDDILGVLSLSYEISISCLLVPIFLGLLIKKPPKEAGLLAMIFGIIGFFIFWIYPLGIAKEFLSIISSALGFACGYGYSLWLKKTT